MWSTLKFFDPETSGKGHAKEFHEPHYIYFHYMENVNVLHGNEINVQ
jgi:hypothetical protein